MLVNAKDLWNEVYREVFDTSLEPISGSQWCEENYVLPETTGSLEPFIPTPYQKGLLDIMCTDNADYEKIIFVKSARIGWTACLVGVIEYQMAKSRRNVNFYAQNEIDANSMTKDTFDPSFELCKPLMRIMEEVKDQRMGNTVSFKKFGSKILRILGGGVSNNYRRYTIDTAILDELDNFPSDIVNRDRQSEGSPMALAYTRLKNSRRGRMLIAGGTPVERTSSQLHDEYVSADASFKYYVPCPDCHVAAPLEWERMVMTIPPPDGTGKDNASRAARVGHSCANCGYRSTYAQLLWMLEHGRWEVPAVRGNETEPYEGCYIWTCLLYTSPSPRD